MNADEEMVAFALRALADAQARTRDLGGEAEVRYSERDLLTLAGRIESGKIHVAPEAW